jgi:hypothetical protein
MAVTMKKAVMEVIDSLKKLPEPGKKTGSFWNFMKSQLLEEGQWDQEQISVIEKEIDKILGKLGSENLHELWLESPRGQQKFDDDIKADISEMKEDIKDEMIGQVMDRMDDNYAARDNYYPANEPMEYSETGNKLEIDDDEFPDEDADSFINPEEDFDTGSDFYKDLDNDDDDNDQEELDKYNRY